MTDPLLLDLLENLKKTNRPIDTTQVSHAWEFAALAHYGQNRISGEPFITHPTQVAKTLALWNMDTTTILAGLLHDTVEDGGAKREEIEKLFGEEVAILVDGVTNISDIKIRNSRDEAFIENLRKMLLVMAKDLRVVFIRLADRLHNMQTLAALPPEKRIRISHETLDIYAPLAERLGFGFLKGQLEDLAFLYLFPNEYQDLSAKVNNLQKKGQTYINQFKQKIFTLLLPHIPSVTVNIRQKHLYSLFRKLQRPEIDGDLSKIYDLIAARVLVDTVDQCYQALGLIHGRYRPVPYLGVSDFIANPKPNGYRSLHTKVFGPQGKIVEIQIRTHQMNEEAEYGLSAHWHYSQAKNQKATDQELEKKSVFVPENKLSWVKELLTWQKEVADNSEYIKILKFDALQHRNLVFSPKGDVYDLPRGATPVDYAYAVHTGLGPKTKGAIVNGKIVPLNYELKNGDVVEILTDPKRKTPNSDWLSFVVTTTARREISRKSTT